MPSDTREERFFYFNPRVKVLFVLTLLLTSSFIILQVMEYQSTISFPETNSEVESRTVYVEEGDYCRLSIGSINNDWLLLKITSNVSSYIYVRGTTDGDFKQYNTNQLVDECENWFIVTVRPYRDSQINVEWIYYDQDTEEPESDLATVSPHSALLFLTIVMNLLSVAALFRSRLTIVG